MPTRIATLGREKRISTLVRKIYTIDGPDSDELQRRAEAALLKANPQLTRKGAFRVGVTIVVPRVKGLRPTSDVDEARADSKGLSKEATVRLKISGARMDERFKLSQENAQKTLALVNTTEFRNQVRKALPDSMPLIEAGLAEIEKRASENSEKNARLQEAISKAIEGVDVLQALTGRERKS